MAARFSTRELIERLVAFPTVSENSNLDLIGFVQDYLAGSGVPVRLTFDKDRRKANLFATIGSGPGGIVLSGHTDVVPVADQGWSGDPFRVVEREGRLYGRGTADMKSFLAVALTLVPEFLRRGLKTPINLALSYDEEVGCLGVRRLLDDLAAVAGMSVHNFLRAFRKSFGTTPAQYVIDQRLRRARWLLTNTAHDIVAIALETGFSSHSHLTATMHRRHGIPGIG